VRSICLYSDTFFIGQSRVVTKQVAAGIFPFQTSRHV